MSWQTCSNATTQKTLTPIIFHWSALAMMVTNRHTQAITHNWQAAWDVCVLSFAFFWLSVWAIGVFIFFCKDGALAFWGIQDGGSYSSQLSGLLLKTLSIISPIVVPRVSNVGAICEEIRCVVDCLTESAIWGIPTQTWMAKSHKKA